jgi:di/tricarboxylate transporter
MHKINVAVVGLFSIILLIWPGTGVMSWKEAQQKVPWNVFMVYGAGLSMGTALVSSGAAKWLAGTMLGPIVSMTHSLQMIILIWIVTALQVFFTGGGPKTTALTPIVIAHAAAIGADPLVFALVLGMNMQHQYLLPVSNMPNAVAMGTGHISTGELIRTGAVMSILGAGYMTLMVLTYWNWIGVVR